MKQWIREWIEWWLETGWELKQQNEPIPWQARLAWWLSYKLKVW